MEETQQTGDGKRGEEREIKCFFLVMLQLRKAPQMPLCMHMFLTVRTDVFCSGCSVVDSFSSSCSYTLIICSKDYARLLTSICSCTIIQTTLRHFHVALSFYIIELKALISSLWQFFNLLFFAILNFFPLFCVAGNLAMKGIFWVNDGFFLLNHVLKSTFSPSNALFS